MNYKTIEIESRSPSYAALNPASGKIYITYEYAGLILIIDTKKGETENKISADFPTDIVISPSLNKVYVTSASGVYEIDGSTNECKLISKKPTVPSRGLSISNYPSSLSGWHSIAVDSTTNKIYVSNYDNESISVHIDNESDRLEDTISFKQSKWNLLSGMWTHPSIVLVNEDLGVLYVKADVTVSAGGGGGTSEQLLVVDLNSKKIIKRRTIPPTKTQLGFAINRTDNTVFMIKYSQKAIVKYDSYLEEVLQTTVFDNATFFKRIFADHSHFAEVIVINHVTNKVYTSDSKLGLLYEIDG